PDFAAVGTWTLEREHFSASPARWLSDLACSHQPGSVAAAGPSTLQQAHFSASPARPWLRYRPGPVAAAAQSGASRRLRALVAARPRSAEAVRFRAHPVLWSDRVGPALVPSVARPCLQLGRLLSSPRLDPWFAALHAAHPMRPETFGLPRDL